MAKLPKIEQVTASDKEKIEKGLKQYDDMNDYQKTFLSKSVVASLEEYRKKLAEISGKKADDTDHADGDKADGGKTDDGNDTAQDV